MTMAKATKMSKHASARCEGPAYTFFFSFSCVFGVFRLLKKVLSKKSVRDASYRFSLLISITVQGDKQSMYNLHCKRLGTTAL